MGVTEPTHVTDLPDVAVAVVGDGPRTAGLVEALLSAVPGVWLPQRPGPDLPGDLTGLEGVLVGEGAGGHGAVVAAVVAGLPVLCVPPLTDPEQARVLLEAESAHGRALVRPGFARRHDPRFRELRGRVSDGSVGRVRLVRGTEPCEDPDEALAHALDTVAWLVDRPVTSVGVEDGVDVRLVTVRVGDGVLADLELRLGADDPDEVRWEVVGSEGSAEVVASTAHLAEAHRILLTAWVRSLRSGVPTGAGAVDGYAAARGVLAGRRSASGSGPTAVLVPS